MPLQFMEEAEPLAYPDAPSGLSDAAALIAPEIIWQRIEAYIRYRWAERAVTWIVTGSSYRIGTGDTWRPNLTPFSGLTREVWDCELEEWVATTLRQGPLGETYLAHKTQYRLKATVGSTDTPPASVLEAYRRLAEYLVDSAAAPSGAKSHSVDIGQLTESVSLDLNHMGKALQLSGAADLLRPYRMSGVNS